jgi:alginate production protein
MRGSGGARLELGLWAAGARARGEEDPIEPQATHEEDDDEEDDDEEEEEDLRERLTEREDKRRPERSWSTLLADRPLTLSGEFELEPRAVRRRVVGSEPGVDERDRILVESGLEVEAFYTFGPELSLFGQFRLSSERDLLPDVADELSDLYVEPGEIWLISEDVLGSGLDFDVGRLDFEDERRWWWDEEVEAVRLAFEADELEVSLALARRLLPDRFDESEVAPEEDRLLRWIGQAAWGFLPNHGVELFAVHQDDRSSTERVGAVVKEEREDESDARLRWLGARALGIFDLRPRVMAGYWLDVASVRGSERRVEYDDADLPRRSEVQSVRERQVRGLGWDVGANLTLTSLAGEPRIFAGWARGSRDFRQTGLEANEAGFGGVERFPHYGALLDPEFTNLRILTLGTGLSLWDSSSLDLVYHRYRLGHLGAAPPETQLEGELEPRHADLGQELDLVLAIEEWERLELAWALAVFRAGRAFDRRSRGETSLGAFFAIRIAF